MTDYDDLADRAEAGMLAPKRGTVRRGAEATAAGRRALMEATSAESIEAAVMIARGRPRLDAPARAAVTWKVRTTELLDREARRTADARGVTVSQLIRDAVASYVSEQRAS